MDEKTKRKCGICGGAVYLQVERSTIEHPARDERGRFIYELVKDKETGQMYEKQVMVSWPIRGLGTWHCLNGCKDREVKVNRITGSKGQDMVSVSVNRHIRVISA